VNWLGLAERLGQRALGTTGDNPPVGCVIVRDEKLLGVGCTQPGGRPHAETEALAMAGDAHGATVFVTLEPCAHHGKTPPCAEALIKAGIARVVCSNEDPDPRVSGQGFAMLRAAGIAVEQVATVDRTLAGFLTRILKHRPYVTLKLAQSADAMIAAAPGAETQITGEEAKRSVHLMRAQSDAILVGLGTVLADDPELTCRLPGLEHRSPKPFVWGRGPLPESHLKRRGAEVIQSLPDNINRLLLEGGAKTARHFFAQGWIDEIHLFTAPVTLGPQGVKGLTETDFEGFDLIEREPLGPDRLNVYVKRP
jgi:diaminohydroxyphosphoribosylaminopyrimidine deaminase / 5-amino-6-(5-phosphoribosylamino)uracil reductase